MIGGMKQQQQCMVYFLLFFSFYDLKILLIKILQSITSALELCIDFSPKCYYCTAARVVFGS